MAVAYNNIKVPTDGLVLYYDMHNPKSWRGEPTENLFRRDSFLIGGTSPYYTHSGSGLGTTEGGYADPFGGSKAVKYVSGGTYLRYGPINGTHPDFTSGDIYNFSFYAKLVPGASALTSATSDIVDRGTYNFLSQLTYEWKRISFSALHDNSPDYSFIDININSGGEILLSHPQIERRSYATPYVFGERTNTQAVLDLTSKNTLTANNLTYSSENTFSFSDNSNNISIPFSNEFDFSSGQTICMWMKPTGSATRRNPYDQAYGGSGTITYETARTFNYYFGTHGGNSSPYVGRNSGFTVAADELAFVCVSRDQGLNQCDWYKNDTHKTSLDAGGYAATNNGSSQIRVGLGYTGNGGFIGDIYSLALFNRKLSDEEILSMFEMSRHRYGI